MSMFILTACPNDDDDENNFTSEKSKLLGCWNGDFAKLSDKSFRINDLYFWDNGKVTMFQNENNSKEASWSFNNETKTIATTAYDMQWIVTIVDSISWSGLKLWDNNSSATYKRASTSEMLLICISSRKWKNTETSKEIGISYVFNKYLNFTDKGLRYKYSNYLNNGNTIVDYKSQIIKTTNGKITILNPYSWNNTRIEIIAEENVNDKIVLVPF